MTARPRLPRSSFRPPSALNGSVAGRRTVVSALMAGGARQASPSGESHGSRAAAPSPGPDHGQYVPMHQPRAQQLADEKPHAAGGMEVIHVGGAVGIDACEQRHHFRQVAEVVPVDEDARRARDGDEVQGVIGRAAGRQQADDGVDDAALVEDLRERQMLLAQGGDPGRAAGGGGRQRIAQRRVGRHEGAAGKMQPHDLHQHLIAVGGAVERAGAGGVIAAGFRFEQRLAARPCPRRRAGGCAPSPCWARPRASGRPARTRSADARRRARRSAGPARSCRRRPGTAPHRTCRATARRRSPSR